MKQQQQQQQLLCENVLCTSCINFCMYRQSNNIGVSLLVVPFLLHTGFIYSCQTNNYMKQSTTETAAILEFDVHFFETLAGEGYPITMC
jgi:hypothetical protein